MSQLIVSNFEGFRVLIDTDDTSRKPSEVKSSKMSREDIEKLYGPVNEAKVHKHRFTLTSEVATEKQRKRRVKRNAG